MNTRIATEILLLAGLALLAYVILMQQRQLAELEDFAWSLKSGSGNGTVHAKAGVSRKRGPDGRFEKKEEEMSA